MAHGTQLTEVFTTFRSETLQDQYATKRVVKQNTTHIPFLQDKVLSIHFLFTKKHHLETNTDVL